MKKSIRCAVVVFTASAVAAFALARTSQALAYTRSIPSVTCYVSASTEYTPMREAGKPWGPAFVQCPLIADDVLGPGNTASIAVDVVSIGNIPVENSAIACIAYGTSSGASCGPSTSITKFGGATLWPSPLAWNRQPGEYAYVLVTLGAAAEVGGIRVSDIPNSEVGNRSCRGITCN